MLKSASYYYIVIGTFASSAAYLVIVPFITTIAVARGMSPSLALFAVMSTGVANSAGRILAPMISDKIGRTRTIILCALISAVGCVLIVSARGGAYIAAVFLISLSYGGAGGTNPVITTELFGARYSGANYGLVLLSIAGSSIFFGKLSATLSAGGDFTTAFILCACLCTVPITAMLLMRKRCKRLGKTI
jgi:OFA family oxalate/formate antiporter-like MFS transporter